MFRKSIVTPEDLLEFHSQCSERGRELIATKNHDYAGYSNQGQVVDVFKNFRGHHEYGIAVRAGDKLRRMENFAISGGVLKVENESILDTCIDLANYAILYAAYGRSPLTRAMRIGDNVEPQKPKRRLVEVREQGLPDMIASKYFPVLPDGHISSKDIDEVPPGEQDIVVFKFTPVNFNLDDLANMANMIIPL